MPNVTKRVSFSVVIALLLGWGVMSLLILQSSNDLLRAQVLENGQVVRQPRGVVLSLHVDKKVYRAEEPILISLRNDSRENIWIADHGDGCQGEWWTIQRLFDTDDWKRVTLSSTTCEKATYQPVVFDRHSLKTGEWNGLVHADALGDVFTPAETGTYRVAVPFIHSRVEEAGTWTSDRTQMAVSSAFTIQ